MYAGSHTANVYLTKQSLAPDPDTRNSLAESLQRPTTSRRRTTQLVEALAILSGHRAPGTPAAILTDIGRAGEHVIRTTLAELDPEAVDMHSLVIVGSSAGRAAIPGGRGLKWLWHRRPSDPLW